MRSKASTTSSGSTASPVSSSTSRRIASSSVSPSSTAPPGSDHSPFSGSCPRRISSTLGAPASSATITAPTPAIGASGYSRLMLLTPVLRCNPLPAPSQLHRLAVLLGEDRPLHAEPAPVELVDSPQMPDPQQRHDFIAQRQPQHLAHFVRFISLHRSRVVPQNFSHPHHCGQRNHHVPIQPGGQVRVIPQVQRYVRPRLRGIVFQHPVLASHPDHLFHVRAPAVLIAAGHDHRRRFLDLCLVERRSAQSSPLLRRSHHNETPGLQVVSAGRAQARFEDSLQILVRNRLAVETRRRSPLLNRLTQQLLSVTGHTCCSCRLFVLFWISRG